MLHAMKRIWKGWKAFGHGLVTVQNGILLFLVFAFGVGPAAFLARISRTRLLDRKPLFEGEAPESHWIPLEPRPASMDAAARQF